MNVTDGEFQEKVLDKSKEMPVVVDFWAPWCGPCMMLGPVLEKIEKEYTGKVVIAKINVDENKENPAKYGVKGIPAVKMFKGGEVVDEFMGAIPEEKIKEWIDKNL